MTSPTILVAEDSKVVRAVLRSHLVDRGYTVIEAEDGDAALAACRTAAPDAVLLDIEMPGLDGYQVLERLKAGAATRDVPVIMISSKDDVAGIGRSDTLGADDFLFKPIDDALLRLRVDSCLERKRRAREGRQAKR